ncbi:MULTISPECIES: MT-A70 family methyltransferase [unclassified Corynebacterium]|uniref:MT-A70 family methyltransferase n=1 Tax=unclassified Corynebacterium TaxID=2624378 RepID=UPI0029CAA64F|nr:MULTISPECIES: MT-A70 family methyltransferase [unclassified Corynebacterium]WPF66683.1 MT-A70 family methyltransferase [Corynebacterium sp. 22KM0430]WPF69170.1 MT-A70 family methyltransferase [Corynebacterium sp. 21KM1197]
MTMKTSPSEEIAPLPTTEGGFKTILADPPWRFANRTGKVAPEHRRLGRYGTMALDEIKALPVGDVVAKDAHLYLWVPNALLPEGIAVMESWGFRYVSNIIWAKRRKDGGPDGRGVGFYFRNVTEPILFGVRGSMRTLAPGRSTVNMIETRKREHSRKPDEQYDLIESCSPGPYLEMFARYARPGWSVWGNESEDDVTPQGKAQRGYGGGEIERLPLLEPNERMSDWLSDRVARVLAEEYGAGASVQQLATQTGYSIARVRTLLAKGGVTLRGRGRPKKAEPPSA